MTATILDGYLAAAFWTDASPDAEELASATEADLAPESRAAAARDCDTFWAALAPEDRDALADALSLEGVGHDLWLTRNGHGAGFWDRGLDDLGDRATALADRLGESHLVRGDDGRVYLE